MAIKRVIKKVVKKGFKAKKPKSSLDEISDAKLKSGIAVIVNSALNLGAIYGIYRYGKYRGAKQNNSKLSKNKKKK